MGGIADDEFVSPKAATIASELSQRIVAGRYPEGSWFPTERELVEEFRVSRTVIREAVEVLEQKSLVLRSPRCRAVVQKSASSASEKTFEKPFEKTSEAESARRTLGLWVWPSPNDPASYAMMNGIYQALDHKAFRLVVGNAYGTAWPEVLQSEIDFLNGMAQDKDIAGIILWYLGGERNLPALQTLRDAGIPLVFIDRHPPQGFDADYVGVDNVQAAETTVRHLIGLGHRRIAHITNMDQASTVLERMQGYRCALEDAGLCVDAELIVTHEEPSTPGDTPQAVFERMAAALLRLPNPPTAVFAVNDSAALHFVDALRVRGLRVPDDMSVVGFDGMERWTPGSSFLTTANQPFQRIGKRAVELLLHRIKAGTSAAYRHVVLEAPLSVYSSTSALQSSPAFGYQKNQMNGDRKEDTVF